MSLNLQSTPKCTCTQCGLRVDPYKQSTQTQKDLCESCYVANNVPHDVPKNVFDAELRGEILTPSGSRRDFLHIPLP